MKTLIQSFSFTSGAILQALASTAVVWLLCCVCSAALRKLSVVIVPFVLAYCLYWFPVWFSGEPSWEYRNWMFVFLVPWFLAGAIPSVVVVWIFEKRHRSRD